MAYYLKYIKNGKTHLEFFNNPEKASKRADDLEKQDVVFIK